ncbi:MAG: metallophosphoesterase [Vitreimonas sp.]
MSGWRRPWLSWCMMLAAGGLLAWVAFWEEPRSTSLTALSVETPAWPAGVAPVRVVFLSDIHVDGAHMPRERVARIAETASLLDPDIVLLGGDFIGGMGFGAGPSGSARIRRSAAENSRDERALAALGAMRARYGVFAAIGNHDCWWDCQRMRAILEAAGVTVLSNEAREIVRPGQASVWIAGVADADIQSPDFERVHAQIPEGAAALLVMHDAGLFDWEVNRFPVQFAGHTHAGQVRFPFIGAPARMSRHTEDTADGFTIEGGRIFIVSRGMGTVGLPVRFGAAPQIMLVRVQRGVAAAVRKLS